MKHALQSPAFLDPFWFNEMRRGPQEGVAISESLVEVCGKILRCKEGNISLVPGEKVHVVLYRDFFFQTAVEIEEEKLIAQIERERKALQAKAEATIRKARADVFNTSLRIPVRWVPGQKDVISGLREGSWGDGSYASSVVHVLLQEPIIDGRFRREAGWFLCTSSRHKNGKNWSGQPAMGSRDVNGEWYSPQVTCKVCLKRAERWTHV